ncbi:MAG: M20/M25/M40 family metallo-hydrolase [Sphingobacteriales bacterium]|nr:MAG: M20/M25/M40 family metallo-hydrolase [Sphingobacteriales bacterium]
MKRYIISAIAGLAVLNGYAQDVNKLIKQADVTRIIKTLAADDMQGRATFTPHIRQAAEFIAGEFKNIGLTPLQGNTGYLQNFTATSVKPISTQVIINGNTVAADSVFAMAGASFKWSNNDADVQVVTIDSAKNFREEYMKYMNSGKKLLILVNPKFAATFKRIQGRMAEGSVSLDEQSSQSLVFVLGERAVKTFGVNYTAKIQRLPLFNVAGVIKGKTKPNEYVVFSGHYDHLGVIQPVDGDAIANGADDDASGTTAVIALAKYYKKLNNNARTLIFVAFTAEEIGGYGSQYFSKQVNPDKTVAMFNIEMIGKPSKFGKNSAFITGYERSDFGAILQKNLKGTAFKFHPDPYPEQQLFYRSDNATLAKFGVPAHTISTDEIDIDKLYHTVNDEFSSLDMDNITSTIRAIALSSRSIVSGKDTPKRIPKRSCKGGRARTTGSRVRRKGSVFTRVPTRSPAAA